MGKQMVGEHCYSFSVMSGRVFLGRTSTKQLAQGHNTVTAGGETISCSVC